MLPCEWARGTRAVQHGPFVGTALRAMGSANTKWTELTSSNSLGFLNTSRSRKIVRDVWSRNNHGEVLVDWVDILIEYDWEIMFT